MILVHDFVLTIYYYCYLIWNLHMLSFYYHYVGFIFIIKNLLNSLWWASITLLLIFATNFTKWIFLFYLIAENLQLDKEKITVQNFVHPLLYICAYHCDGVKSNNVELSILFCWKRNIACYFGFSNSRLVNNFLTTSSNSF